MIMMSGRSRARVAMPNGLDYIFAVPKGLFMSAEPNEPDERPCLHCSITELIEDFFAEYPAEEADTIDTDEVIEALAKTVAEMTAVQDESARQQIVERLMQQIMAYDAEYRKEDAIGGQRSGARH